MELTGEKKDWGRGMAEAFSMVKDQAPLVHMIANYVTASFCADAMAAMGARPLMAQAPEEMEEITGSADGLAVNLGQPSEEKYLACERALQTAGNLGLPAVLDPVGAGASGYRKKASASLCAASWPGRAWSGVLKGNSSEIHTVLTGAAAHSGVDSVGTFSHLEEEAAFLRDMREKGRKMVILETGAVDKLCWISESGGKDRIFRAAFGHEKSRRVNLVGTGCVTGAWEPFWQRSIKKREPCRERTGWPFWRPRRYPWSLFAARPLGTEGMEHINGSFWTLSASRIWIYMRRT